MPQFEQLNIHSYKNTRSTSTQYIDLFRCEELKAAMVLMQPGSEGEWHIYGNSHKLFDVVEGEGTFLIEDRVVAGAPGKSVLIPAGVRHKLRNDGDAPWVLRVTIHERIYPRHIGKLIARSFRKRFGLG